MRNNPENEINQLLSKIKRLEEKNDRMRQKIKDKKTEIKNFENPQKSKQELTKKKPKEKKIITEDEDRKAELRFRNEMKFLNNNELQIKENLVEQIIQFMPQENYGVMYIMGDFNGWEPELMKKDKEVFYFKIVLIKGFKYYYIFHSNDQNIINFEEEHEENPVNLEVQNYIELFQDKEDKTNFFDYKTDSNILKAAQRNYTLLEINDDIENTIFLEKFQRHVKACKPEKTENEEVPIEYAINLYYENLLNKIDIYDKDKLENLKLYFNNRILLQNSTIMDEVQYQYKILEMSNDYFICMRLFDHNRIKLNSIYYADLENCWKIPFNEIVLKPITKKDKLYHLLSVKESQKIIKDFENNKEDVIIAHFDDLDNLNKNKSFSKKYKNLNINNDGELVKPKRIEPDDVEMNDYEYYFLNGEIIKIRNKEDNSFIEYEIFEDKKKAIRIREQKPKEVIPKKDIIDEKKEVIEKNVTKKYISKYNKKEIIEKNDKEDKKDISEKKDIYEKKDKKEIIKKKEKKPPQYLVYYTLSNKKTIILHCHILDNSFKYKKITIKEIKDNIDPHILKQDKQYINSNNLLLITNSTGPIKLYYKGKKVQMESKLIDQNKLYKLESPNEFESIFHQMIVSIFPINNNKLNNDLIEKCKENTCNGKDILDGIDVKVEYNNTFDENMMLAASPCLLRELSTEEENSLKKQENNKQKKNVTQSYEMQKFDLIKREMEKYRKYTKEAIKKMTRSQKDNIALTLEDYKSTMEFICVYVQDKELWDMIEEVSSITNEIENLLNLIDSS